MNERPVHIARIVLFVLAGALALVVWRVFPEPEESRRGYTARECYDEGYLYYQDARRLRGAAHDYPRSERNIAAVRYLEALESRFGISPGRWDAYLMLANARCDLADAGERNPDLRERFRLEEPAELRRKALAAYHAAVSRLPADAPERPVILRQTAEVGMQLGRPDQALEILRELITRYRVSRVDFLRRERGERIDADMAEEASAELADEARTVYFLAGKAAQTAAHLDEAARSYRLFIEAGGSGERRIQAERALGDIAFERARGFKGAERLAVLEDARTYYSSAGTLEAVFLLGRVLYALGEYDGAQRLFSSRLQTRAGAFMLAMTDLASGKAAEARAEFLRIQAEEPESAEGAAALVALAGIAAGSGDLDRAAAHLERVVESARNTQASMAQAEPLPERDDLLDPGHLAARLVELAAAFEERGDFSRAIDLYSRAASLRGGRDPGDLGRIALAHERRAKSEGRRESLERAAEVYLELARKWPPGEARRESHFTAAQRFAEAGRFSRAIETARLFVSEYPEDWRASRATHELAGWEAALGLFDRAEARYRRNIELHGADHYADLSRLELARLRLGRGSDEARENLRRILLMRDRYEDDSLIRIEALFLLGRLCVEMAEREVFAGREEYARDLVDEGAPALDEALAFEAGDGVRRPLLAALIAEHKPAALDARARAAALIAELNGEVEADAARVADVEPLWNAVDAFAARGPANLRVSGEEN